MDLQSLSVYIYTLCANRRLNFLCSDKSNATNKKIGYTSYYGEHIYTLCIGMVDNEESMMVNFYLCEYSKEKEDVHSWAVLAKRY